MDNTAKKSNDYYIIDIVHILKTLLSKLWIIAIVSVLSGIVGFSVAKFSIKPSYSSSILLYVNNSSVSLKDVGVSISTSDISAAQELVKTYTVLLKNRTTLTQVIKETGVNYTWKELNGKISASSENGTEIMRITVTTHDPYESKKIANGIATVLPRRVNEIVDGTSVEIVDSAIANLAKVAPSVSRYTITYAAVGFAIVVAIISLLAIMDNTIHDDEYIRTRYDYPILAKVPDLVNDNKKKYSYYYKKRAYGSDYYYRDNSSTTNNSNGGEQK